jgi:mannose/fructose/N-acetylgalactosamine-specific phosphotransferase system component IID
MMNKKITYFTLLKVFLKSFLIQAVWNYQSMQSIGFCFALSPVGKKLFNSTEQRKEFYNRHLNFFNAHPYFSSYALGAITKIEEELSEKENPDYEIIARFKNALIGPLGAIGDQLVWATIKPTSVLIGLIGVVFIVDVQAKIYFIFLLLLIYNIPHIYIRLFGIFKGYNKGFEVSKVLNAKNYEMMRDIYGVLGTVALGIYIGFSLMKYGTNNILDSGFFIFGALFSYIMYQWKKSIYRSIIFPIVFGTFVGYLVEVL